MSMKNKFLIIIFLIISTLISVVSAASNTIVTSTIMGRTPLGLLIPLHIEDYFPADVAIMYYNYIAVALVVTWAAFASQSNESRYTFTTPLFAALMVWVGWLNAGSSAVSSTQYWGSILLCLVLGAFMYLNDMNHEKYGMPGTGDKLMAVAFMIMCFSAAFGFVASSEFGLFEEDSSGASQNQMCGKAYTCDSAGNIDLSSSVTTVSSSGGIVESILSDAYFAVQIAIGALKMAIVVVASVLFFSGVILAAYPALSASPQVVAFLVVMNVVIWAIYYATFFRWYYKPGVGEGQI